MNRRCLLGSVARTLVFYEVLGGVRVWRVGRVVVPVGAGGGLWGRLGASGPIGGFWGSPLNLPGGTPKGAVGGFWEPLGGFGGLWELLGASGGLWGRLGASGWSVFVCLFVCLFVCVFVRFAKKW